MKRGAGDAGGPGAAGGATAGPPGGAGERLFALARRVADAHRALAPRFAFVSGSTVDGSADERSDVDMSIVFDALPDEAALRAATAEIGEPWHWHHGCVDDGAIVVALRVDVVEVQIVYATRAAFDRDLDTVLVDHAADTPNHKLAEGVAKALPLAGDADVAARKQRVAAFPPALGRAMIDHALSAPRLGWRGIAQLVERDAAVWCREVQVDACYALLLALAGLNQRYFTRFQFKRLTRFCDSLAIAPPALAVRITTLLAAPSRAAFDALHALEGEVVDLVAAHRPDVDVEAARRRHAVWREPSR